MADDFFEIWPHFADCDLTFFEVFNAGSWFESCCDYLRPFAQFFAAVNFKMLMLKEQPLK